MLYLLGELSKESQIFNLFRYITFRTGGAVVTAMLVVFVLGPWLIDSLRFPADGVRVLFGERGESSVNAGAATSKAITEAAVALRTGVAPDGRLWVFFLGHGNLREKHFYFHFVEFL